MSGNAFKIHVIFQERGVVLWSKVLFIMLLSVLRICID